MNSISECLTHITDLTRKNLQILKTLNDSFYTRKEHLAVKVDDTTFVIPSFLSLENKIDTLQQNLDNILNAPVTGEAFTYFDGSTQKIELSGYATSPNRVNLETVNEFAHQQNNIFKDFMTPVPYVRLGVQDIAHNIKHLNIKKIVIKNDDLRTSIDNLVSRDSDHYSYQVAYEDVVKKLDPYEEGIDYDNYDTIKRIPLRAENAIGEYDIVEIVDTYTDKNFDEFYELKLDRSLTYFIKNGTIERDIKVGDYLVTYNGRIKLEVTEVYPVTQTIKVRVMYGAYADLCDRTSANPDLYKLKYYRYSDTDFNAAKYVDVELEENQYICIFISAINDTTNLASPFGLGLYIDVYGLTDADGTTFESYYKTYVNNVGDALYSITHMMDDDQQIEKLSKLQFETLRDLKPVISQEDLTVTQINKHLNDSEPVAAIRKLYNQKSQYKSDLESVQNSITNLNDKLAEVAFDDTSNVRQIYQAQLSELSLRKRELNNSITEIIREISNSANSSDIPIENAKYHIRGFLRYYNADDKSVNGLAQVIKLEVEYRYKNRNKFIGNAETIGDSSLIFSDWNRMQSDYRYRVPVFDKDYAYEYEEDTEMKNLYSFNQIDIPITQGESVDIRYRYIYNLGYPFIKFTSDWSDIYNIEFPEEYLTDVEILDIIAENNDDIKKNQFLNLLDQQGVTSHMSDTIQDESISYFHQPEHIASGYYTEERKIIPLKDKLDSMIDIINDLQAEVYGATSENLIVTLKDSTRSISLKPNTINKFKTTAWSDNQNQANGLAYELLAVQFFNAGKYNIKLHTLFPGDYQTVLNSVSSDLSTVGDYAEVVMSSIKNHGVWMQYDDYNSLQRFNQWCYFRTVDRAYNKNLYDASATNEESTSTRFENGLPQTLNMITEDIITKNSNTVNVPFYASLYPYPGIDSTLSIDNQSTYAVLKPGETLSIPLNFYYRLSGKGTVGRAIEFDIRPSLFKEPITYKIVVSADYVTLANFKVRSTDSLSLDPLAIKRNAVYNVNLQPESSKLRILKK